MVQAKPGSCTSCHLIIHMMLYDFIHVCMHCLLPQCVNRQLEKVVDDKNVVYNK